MSLAVAATFSIEPLSRWLQFWLDELGLAPTLRFAQYNSLIAELISPNAFKGASACAGLINFADWQRALEGAPFDPQRFEADLQLLVDGIESALDLSFPRLVLFLCPSRPIACPSAAARNTAFTAGLFFSLQPHFSHKCRRPLFPICPNLIRFHRSGHPSQVARTLAPKARYTHTVRDLRMVPCSRAARPARRPAGPFALHGGDVVCDRRLRRAVRCPPRRSISNHRSREAPFFPYVGSRFCHMAAEIPVALPALSPPLKALVLDCDYTLWHHAGMQSLPDHFSLFVPIDPFATRPFPQIEKSPYVSPDSAYTTRLFPPPCPPYTTGLYHRASLNRFVNLFASPCQSLCQSLSQSLCQSLCQSMCRIYTM